MSRFECEAQEATAPRIGCACRSCYRAREASLDPRLIELVLVRETWKPGFVTISRGREILRLGVDSYLAGRIEWAALYIDIIRALIEDNDKLFKQAMDLVGREQIGLFLPERKS